MSGISSILEIARGALATQQNALEVSGHNVANVDTPGYSVQRTILEPGLPVPMDFAMVGTGVKTVEIRRIYSQFLNDQLNEKHSLMYQWEAQRDILSLLEASFNESGAGGMNQLLSEFWNSWEEVANNPEGLAQRNSLVATAITLAGAFNSKGEQLSSIKEDLNSYIQVAVTEVNRYAEQLAELNKKIVSVESEHVNANDFRDQRDLILEKLAQFFPINYVENPQGMISVFIPGGYALVEGTTAQLLETRLDSQNSLRVYWNGDTDMTTRLGQGKLGGWLELRDTVIPGYQETLNSLAAHLANSVNSQHRQGYGLDDVSGRDFFSYQPGLMALAHAENRGDAAFGVDFQAGTYDPDLVTGDSYDLAFSGGGLDTLTITNRSTGQTAIYVRTGNTYTFDGLEVTLSGNHQAGDKFSLRANWNMAANLGVDQAIVDDSSRIAAASQINAPGDNSNALAMTDLRHQNETILGQTGTLSEIYDAGLVGEVGSDVAKAANLYEYNQALVQQISNRRDSVAGVSLDEEMTNIIKFQYAFSAAARLVTLADEMLETVLNTRR
jgi:flagellar hook-associated protein 1 FlgK